MRAPAAPAAPAAPGAHSAPALLPLAMLVAWIGACAPGTSRASADATASTTLSASGGTASGWVDLNSADAWRGYRRNDLPPGWRFDSVTRELTRVRGGGDIITRAQFMDFELELEWKVVPRGNSGIFFRANEGTGRIYENAAEMQVLDNVGNHEGPNPITAAGSNYALHGAVRDVALPGGEWNRARIVARGPRVEHWLNGVKLFEYELWTDEWKAKVAASKFAQWPTYALARRGHIGLQDHGDVVSFRNIRVREITP